MFVMFRLFETCVKKKKLGSTKKKKKNQNKNNYAPKKARMNFV